MSEDFLRSRLYEYAANSNLVLEAERDRRRGDEGKGEVESLRDVVGSIKMGERVKSSRPDSQTVESNAKRRRTDDDNFAKPAKRVPVIPRGANVLSVADEIDGESYHPKSVETKSAFEEFTVEVQKLLGDQPQDVLRGATFELLEIFKDNSIADYRKIEEASKLTRVNRDTFSTLLMIANRITDFSVGGQAAKTTEGDEEITEDMAVVFEDEEDNDGGSDEDDDNDDENDVGADEEDERERSGLHMFGARGGNGQNGQNSGLNVHDIDAYWLQRQISKIKTDANVAARVAEEALAILKTDDDRVCENNLVALLDYDNFDLVKLLVTNKQKIYYAIKLKQAQNEAEKRALETELAQDNSGRQLLEQLKGRASAQEYSRTRTARGLQDGASGLDQEGDGAMDVDEYDASVRATQSKVGAPTLHLEDLAFSGSNHFMANERCELPEKSWRVQKKGYEEVHVPALKAPVVNSEQLKSIASMPSWMHTCFEGVKHLNRVQSKLCDYAIESEGNMLLCAPTGSGKTNVALLCMLGLISRFRNDDGSVRLSDFKIVYVAPMKALVHECVQNFSKRLAPLNITVKELSGDQSLTQAEINSTQIIVTTPEKWDVITRKAGDRAYLQLVRLMIVDEIHLLHDERGAVLESIIGRTIRTTEETKEVIRMVGLSATLPNYEDVAAFMRVDPAKGLFYFDNSFRPVPLQQQFIGVTEKKALKKVQIMNEICYEKILLHAGKNQILIFTHSRADTMKTARALVEMCQANETLSKFVKEGSASSEILRAEAPNAKNADLQELIQYGFAFHHAGLARADRTLVEDLFADKHVQILVSTATLAWGVNLPVHTVIIKGTQVYSPELGRWTELSALDVLQMMGRAGRYGLDSEGEGIILTQHSELQYYLSLMNQQLPIESHMIKRLPEALNAEIVLGSITSIKDAVTWLGYTYLYVRMLRNPSLYGVQEDDQDRFLHQRRFDLAYAAIVQLEKRGMLQFNRQTGSVVSNYVGRIASYYYVTHDTMDTYVKHLRPSMTEIELFRLVSLSSEFKNIYIRPEEKLELTKLITRVPIPIKESVEEPCCKINVLLQAYISKLKLEGFALSADMVFIQQSAARLLRCLFELAWKKRWASVAVKLLELAIMVDRKLWRSQSPLRQFTAIPEVLVRKLERISDIVWSKYQDLTPQDLGEMVKMPKMGKTLYKFVHMVPRVHIDLRAYPISRSLLRLDVELTPDFEFNEQMHGRAVLFWLMVEDGDGEKLLHTEPISLYSGKQSCRTSCTVDLVEPLPPQYFLRVVADRWLHANQVVPISFKHLLLPERFPLPTQVLDLKPVSVPLLQDPIARSFFAADGIDSLNSIQTQTFHALFETDHNVLVCAPSGAGKTLCAELALLRYLTHSRTQQQQSPGGKVLYLCPHQEWCVTLCRLWAPKLQTLFGDDEEGVALTLLTGDAAVDYEAMKVADVIVSTPAHWNLLSRKWKQRKLVQQIGLYLFDHVHTISSAQGEGSVAYEMVISRSRFIATQQQLAQQESIEDPAERAPAARFVALGYAVANARDLGEWLGVTSAHSFYFAPHQAPGTVSLSFLTSDHHDQNLRISSLSKHMFSAVGTSYQQAHAALGTNTHALPTTVIFAPNRKLSRLAAIDLVSYANNRKISFAPPHQTSVAFEEERAEVLRRIRTSVADLALQEVLPSGVGYLYEGQSAAETALVEELYLTRQIHVLIVPFRLAYRFTYTADRVYLMDTQYFDGKVGLEVDVDVFGLQHMVGRARHTLSRGHVQVYCPAAKREHLERMVSQLLPVESRLHTQLGDHLLGEVVAKTIETKADSVDFLTWTFLYRRLPKNPNFYGMLGSSVRHISDYLSELVEESITELEENKFIAVEDNDLDVTALNLGMIAAYYGLSSDTVAIVANSLTAKSRISALLDVLACAQEFEDEIPLRVGESGLLLSLARSLKLDSTLLQTDNDQLSDTARKVLVLLRAYMHRHAVSYELAYDLQRVLQRTSSLLHAVVDVLASQGWLKAALAAMELQQMLVQATHEQASVLSQLPHMTTQSLQSLQKPDKHGEEAEAVDTIFDFLNLEDDRRSRVLEGYTPAQVSDIARFCNAYPSIDVAFDLPGLEAVGGENDEEEEDKVYRVDIESQTSVKVVAVVQRDNLDEDTDLSSLGKVVASRFPHPKREEWWLLVGDAKTNTLYGIKRFTLTQRAQVKIDFELPSDLSETSRLDLKLYLMCDAYVGCDQEYAFRLLLN